MSGPESAAVQRERASLIDRLMGLSDGLFAIAMTLLILNIEVPDLPEGRADELAGDLATLDTAIYVWLLSFAVLALLWRAQHLALDRLRRLDNVVVVLNFIVLALATAVPFSSELLGEYSGQSVAVAIYAANISIASLAIAAISWWSDLRGNQLEGSKRGIRWPWCPARCFSSPSQSPSSTPTSRHMCGSGRYSWYRSAECATEARR